jgi:hypothetical protein
LYYKVRFLARKHLYLVGQKPRRFAGRKLLRVNGATLPESRGRHDKPDRKLAACGHRRKSTSENLRGVRVTRALAAARIGPFLVVAMYQM